METLRYCVAALALGLIAVWGSENFFWSAPPADLTPLTWMLTWLAYSLCAAAALSAVHLTGIGGVSGVFLGAGLMGFLVEGVIVDQMYAAFPFQLIWTPLAWHGLVTGVCVFGLGRVGPHWPLGRHLAALLALGLFGALAALYWPLERGTMPRGDLVLAYLAGMSLVVPLGHVAIERIGTVPRPPLWVALVVPVLAVALWLGKSLADPRPERLAFPVMVGLTLWAMQRLGGPRPVRFGPCGPVWRQFLFPLAPLTTTLIAVPIWQDGTGWPGNIPVAIATVGVSLLWWLGLLWRALRQTAGGKPAGP